MSYDAITPLGLRTRGPMGFDIYDDDGTYGWDHDSNMRRLDYLISELQSSIEGIAVSGLPSTIDVGTF